MRVVLILDQAVLFRHADMDDHTNSTDMTAPEQSSKMLIFETNSISGVSRNKTRGQVLRNCWACSENVGAINKLTLSFTVKQGYEILA